MRSTLLTIRRSALELSFSFALSCVSVLRCTKSNTSILFKNFILQCLALRSFVSLGAYLNFNIYSRLMSHAGRGVPFGVGCRCVCFLLSSEVLGGYHFFNPNKVIL